MTVRSLLADPSTSGAWTLAADRSSVRFSNKTLWGLFTVKGQFTDVAGSGEIGADGSVSGRLVIRADSLATGIGKRDEHLRSPDFFDTDASPEIVIDVTGATPTGEHTADLAATLTVRGTTRPLPMQATVTLLGNDTLHVVGRATIDRTEWGVSGNMAGMMPTTTALVADTTFLKS
ncbi:MAG: YceI family protein [Mycobacterium sp.]|jgi:polyisoprenoid-binding protein YceI|nr:YceI family protein [Mycobacterium sp.]